MKHTITCRYGITYKVELKGSKGAQARTIPMLQNCCCWVCYNRDCKEPKNEKIIDCKKDCSFWTSEPWCEKSWSLCEKL